jgi:hypothetical protein
MHHTEIHPIRRRRSNMEAILMADDEDWVYVLSPEERVEDVEAVAVAVEETVTVDDDVEDVAVAVEETVDEDVEAVAVAVEEMVDEDVEDVAVAVEEMVDEDVEDVAVAVEETVDEDVEDVAVAVEETVEEDAEAVAVADAVTVTAAIAGEDNPHDASAAEEQEESDEEEEEAKVGAQPAAEELLPNIDEQGEDEEPAASLDDVLPYLLYHYFGYRGAYGPATRSGYGYCYYGETYRYLPGYETTVVYQAPPHAFSASFLYPYGYPGPAYVPSARRRRAVLARRGSYAAGARILALVVI